MKKLLMPTLMFSVLLSGVSFAQTPASPALSGGLGTPVDARFLTQEQKSLIRSVQVDLNWTEGSEAIRFGKSTFTPGTRDADASTPSRCTTGAQLQIQGWTASVSNASGTCRSTLQLDGYLQASEPCATPSNGTFSVSTDYAVMITLNAKYNLKAKFEHAQVTLENGSAKPGSFTFRNVQYEILDRSNKLIASGKILLRTRAEIAAYNNARSTEDDVNHN